MPVRAVLIWCVLLVVASINGIAREAVLIPRIGDAAGRVTVGHSTTESNVQATTSDRPGRG
jgi:hypothetical protein